MTGIIWYKDREHGFERLDQLIEHYSRLGVTPTKVKKSYFFAFAHFDNGDYWRVFSANDNNRGASCNVSLIEDTIDRDIVNCIIKPCTKAFPYQAFAFYSGEKFF